MNIGGGSMVGATSMAAGMTMRSVSPFTVSQWQELEQQALIFKYLMAGLSVPPDLVFPIQKSFESMSARFFHHPTMGYSSFYGKKVDPEPGRCKRTDGKKWRCSKDAYLESKYCERHMHRGRNRSRKPVESQTISQSSSTVTSLSPTGGSSGGGGGGGGTTTFQNLPLHAFANPQSSTAAGANQVSHYNVDHIPFGIPSKDYRYLQGVKTEVGEHRFFSEASGANRSLQIESPLDNAWSMLPSRVSLFPSSKSNDNSILQQSDYPQYSFFTNEFVSGEPVKQEGHSLRPFFDEWPKARDSWSSLEDERSNHTSFSTTQLSISIPMTSSDFSATSSLSPHDN